MTRVVRLIRDDLAAREAARRTASLAGLAATLAVLVASLFVVQQMERCAARERCVLAGLSCTLRTDDAAGR